MRVEMQLLPSACPLPPLPIDAYLQIPDSPHVCALLTLRDCSSFGKKARLALRFSCPPDGPDSQFRAAVNRIARYPLHLAVSTVLRLVQRAATCRRHAFAMTSSPGRIVAAFPASDAWLEGGQRANSHLTLARLLGPPGLERHGDCASLPIRRLARFLSIYTTTCPGADARARSAFFLRALHPLPIRLASHRFAFLGTGVSPPNQRISVGPAVKRNACRRRLSAPLRSARCDERRPVRCRHCRSMRGFRRNSPTSKIPLGLLRSSLTSVVARRGAKKKKKKNKTQKKLKKKKLLVVVTNGAKILQLADWLALSFDEKKSRRLIASLSPRNGIRDV
ncbi:hypothetical protein FN846DRAFT_968139, partial [Sphaerosporella brunnea]